MPFRMVLNNQKGAVLGLVLFVFTVFSALTWTIYKTYSGAAQDKAIAESVAKLISQSELIKGKVMQCLISYSSGNPIQEDFPFFDVGSNDINSLLCSQSKRLNLWSDLGGVAYLEGSPEFLSSWRYINSPAEIGIEIDALDGNPIGKEVLKHAHGKLNPEKAFLSSNSSSLKIIYKSF